MSSDEWTLEVLMADGPARLVVSYDVREILDGIRNELRLLREQTDGKASETELNELDGRVRRLETWRTYLAGGVTVALFCGSAALDIVIRHYF